MSLSCLNHSPMEKISLDTMRLSCLMFGLLQYYFLCVFLDWLRRFYDFFSRSQSHLELFKPKKLVQADRKNNHEYSELLNQEDKNLRREEILMVMGSLGIFCHPEGVAEKLQERFDSDDLSKLFEEEEPSLEEIKAAFDVFDENRDGFIDASELQTVLCVLGFKQGGEMENCRKMIKAFDKNGDGRIDFNEFVKFMENSFC